MTLPLAGLGVLVTRPAHQASEFILQLQMAGAETFALPAMEIQPLSLNASTQQRLQKTDYQLVIFISANAVLYGLPVLQHLIQKPTTKIAAIGGRTAHTLQAQGLAVDLRAHTGQTSEDLLALPALQKNVIAGTSVLIVRGQGGREVLSLTLQSRGALVNYAEVYTGNRPQSDTQWLANLWRQQRIHIVCVTSNAVLENLYHMLQHYNDPLLNTVLLVPGERCKQLAQTLRFKKIIQATSACDNDMLQRIHQWHQTGT